MSQLKYLKCKYNLLKSKLQQKTYHEVPSIYIDVYKFKLMNYSDKSSGEIFLGELSKTVDINKGIVKSISDIPDVNENSYYSIDYIKSNNISNKYYKHYLKFPAKNREYKYVYTKEYTDELKKNIVKVTDILRNKLSELTNEIDKIKNDNGYIKKIFVSSEEKIIVFGDNHGSFHTFFRNMLRLHLCGVLNLTTFTVNENYRLIFLGDIVDRGSYSLEILEIMFHFIINNPDKFIINRGNHEDVRLSSRYGFKDEIMEKTNDEQLFVDIIRIFTLCSTAIILVNKSTNKRYWLCHGLICDSIDIEAFINNDKLIFILDDEQAFNIRWSDTPFIDHGLMKDTIVDIGSGRPKIGTDVLTKYLKHLDFIIRGHEDHFSNAWLLNSSKYKIHMGIDYMNQSGKFKLYKKNNTLVDLSSDISINNYNQLDGPVQTVTNIADGDTFNIMTISTNTDLGRPLTSDSYIVMRFNEHTLPDVATSIKSDIEIVSWLTKNDITIS